MRRLPWSMIVMLCVVGAAGSAFGSRKERARNVATISAAQASIIESLKQTAFSPGFVRRIQNTLPYHRPDKLVDRALLTARATLERDQEPGAVDGHYTVTERPGRFNDLTLDGTVPRPQYKNLNRMSIVGGRRTDAGFQDMRIWHSWDGSQTSGTWSRTSPDQRRINLAYEQHANDAAQGSAPSVSERMTVIRGADGLASYVYRMAMGPVQVRVNGTAVLGDQRLDPTSDPPHLTDSRHIQHQLLPYIRALVADQVSGEAPGRGPEHFAPIGFAAPSPAVTAAFAAQEAGRELQGPLVGKTSVQIIRTVAAEAPEKRSD